MKYLVSIILLVCLWPAAWANDNFPISNSLLEPLPLITAKYVKSLADNKPSSVTETLDMSERPEGSGLLSMRKAMLLSLVVPGTGQYYAGSKFKGQVFMGVELAIWGGFFGYRIYGGWKEDEYKNYASAHAGLDNTGKDEQFYDWVGFYNSRDEFNELGRIYYPERAYLPDTREYYWQWGSDEERVRFKDLKDAAKRAFRNSTFVLGLAILNRVVAGIDTYRTVKSANKAMKSMTQFGEYKLKVSPKISADNPSIKITLSRKF